MVPRGELTDLDILFVGVLEVHHPGPDGGDGRLGDDQGVAVAVVEPVGQLAGQLEVLALVVADGHPLGVVEQDVGGLEDRVGEQADPHRLLCRRSSP